MKGAGRLLWASSPALAAIGQVMKGGAIILLALGGSGFTLGSALTLAYFAMAANNAPHEALLNEAIPSERRSVMLSLHSLSMFLGIALGSSLLGWLASMFGTRFALFVGGGFTVLASLAYIGVVLAQRRKSVEDIKGASWKKDEIAL